MARQACGLAHHQPYRLDTIGLLDGGIDAVVADERIGQYQQLTRIGGVGEHLLVASHGGVEHDLAVSTANPPERTAGKYGTISEHEKPFRHVGPPLPAPPRPYSLPGALRR